MARKETNTELYDHSFMLVWGLFLLEVAAGVYYLPGLDSKNPRENKNQASLNPTE